MKKIKLLMINVVTLQTLLALLGSCCQFCPEYNSKKPSMTISPEIEIREIEDRLQNPTFIPTDHQPYIHTVAYFGETLSNIAAWYTGNLRNWRKLLEANPRIDPKRMQKGDKIIIPEDLIIRREPMPEEYLTSLRHSDVKSNRTNAKGESTQIVLEDLKTSPETRNSPSIQLQTDDQTLAENKDHSGKIDMELKLIGPIEKPPGR